MKAALAICFLCCGLVHAGVVKPPPPKPILIHLAWTAAPDPRVVSYAVAHCCDLRNPVWNVVTNVGANLDAYIIEDFPLYDFYLVIGVDADGLNTFGNYQ